MARKSDSAGIRADRHPTCAVVAKVFEVSAGGQSMLTYIAGQSSWQWLPPPVNKKQQNKQILSKKIKGVRKYSLSFVCPKRKSAE